MATSPSSTKCANCSKATEMSCSGCRDAPNLSDGLKSAYYCGTVCQKAHWMEHKSNCKLLKARRTLYRAGDTLQEKFYQYRERVFDRRLAKIEKKGSQLFVYDKMMTEDEGRQLLREDTVSVSFPDEMCKTAEDKKSVLVYMSCSDAVAFFHDLVKSFLSDITSEITEACMTHKDHDQKIVGIHVNGYTDQSFPHVIWIVTLKASDERYALDLTGAQFGFYQPVTPFADFLHSRILKLSDNGMLPEINAFGASLANVKSFLGMSILTPVTVVFSLGMLLSQDFVKLLNAWEKQDGTHVNSFKNMLVAPESEFLKLRDSLVEWFGVGLDACMAEVRIKGAKIFADEAGHGT